MDKPGDETNHVRPEPEGAEEAPLAYENPEFLNSPDGRILRILAEYQEPMSRFRRERVQDTVVFFGSARFRALDVANSELELLANTGSAELAPEKEQPATIEEIQRGEANRLQLKRAEAAVEMAQYYEEKLSQIMTSNLCCYLKELKTLNGHHVNDGIQQIISNQ